MSILTKQEYQDYLETEHWKARSAARRLIDNNTCTFCKSVTNLQVHHITYERIGCEDVEHDLITLCRDCHARLHLQMSAINKELKQLEEDTVREISESISTIQAKYVNSLAEIMGDSIGQYFGQWDQIHLILRTLRSSGNYDWVKRRSVRNALSAPPGSPCLHSLALHYGSLKREYYRALNLLNELNKGDPHANPNPNPTHQKTI